MAQMIILKDHQDWLEHRKGRLGGSDAAAVVGLNPYMSNQDLFEFKTGIRQQEDISDKPYVKYGTEAEQHLRELFKLDFPEYKVHYKDNNMWLNDKFPWAHASLDGWLTDEKGRKGIWECKTTEILRSMQKELWKDRIPDNYFCQILHYLMVTEFEFAVLKCQMKYDFNGEVFLQTKHYKIERSEVEDDISYLASAEKNFWMNVKENKRPNLILPAI